MDEGALEILLGIVATVATVALTYLKSTMGKKGESEKQADIILDFVGEFADGLAVTCPANQDVKDFRRALKKLRRMWDDETVTTDDLREFLEDLEG